MKIYVASSWRNAHQPLVVESIAEWGFEVYDFRNPPHGKGGFAWSQIDPDWQRWTPSQWRDALDHELARDGYASDLGGMEWADACVLVLPSGRSSHLEAGWMAGRGKPVCVFAPEPVEPDLMVKLCDEVAVIYLGRIVEQGAPDVLLRESLHENHPEGAGARLCHTCLVSWYSSSPRWPSSRPIPDCLYPPHSACGT